MSDPGLASAGIVFLFLLIATIFAFFLVLIGRLVNPTRPNPVKNMPYESGMDPIHGARRRFDVRFHLVAIAFLVFDVEVLFLYPWAVLLAERTRVPAVPAGAASFVEVSPPSSAALPAEGRTGEALAPERSTAAGGKVATFGSGSTLTNLHPYAFAAGVLFIALLALGYVYDWRKGVFQWR